MGFLVRYTITSKRRRVTRLSVTTFSEETKMERTLNTVTLRDGRSMRIIEVKDSAPNWETRIAPFLGHKPEPYGEQVRRALRGDHEGVETRFYLGIIEGEIVGNVTTVEKSGVGWMGHVYTDPGRRRVGVAGALIHEQTADFRRRQGRALFLSTRFDSPAYHLYAKFGYRGLEEKSGMMELLIQRDFYDQYFAEHEYRYHRPTWGDGPAFCALCAAPGGERVRSVLLKLFGRSTTEGAYLKLMEYVDSGEWRAVLGLTQTGAVVGFAITGNNAIWPVAEETSYIMDLYVHQDHMAVLPALMEALPPAATRVIIPVDSEGKREQLLSDHGLQRYRVRENGDQADQAPDEGIATIQSGISLWSPAN